MNSQDFKKLLLDALNDDEVRAAVAKVIADAIKQAPSKLVFHTIETTGGPIRVPASSPMPTTPFHYPRQI